MSIQSDGSRKYPNSRVVLSSESRGWSSVSAEFRSHPAGPITQVIQQSTEIVIALRDKAGEVLRGPAGHQQRSVVRAGAIWLVPVGAGEDEIVITEPHEVLHLYLPTQQFTLLAKQHGLARCPSHSIQTIDGLQDDLIHQTGQAILSELEEEKTTSLMFVESAAAMLAARLVDRYSNGSFRLGDMSARGPLSKLRLERVLNYVTQNLENEIKIADLASIANLSPFHFTRMFTATMGVAPFRYVSRRRLSHAMLLLANKDLPISEIAYRSCFSSQANFNRAFRRATGMTPGEYRRLI